MLTRMGLLQLYRAILRATGRRQILLILLSLMVAGLAAVPLDYQKTIINALAGDLDPVRLGELCLGMAAVILLSLGLKFVLGYQSGIVGEDVIRRIRIRVTEAIAEPNPDRPGAVKSGTNATMLSTEAEEVGRFAGSALAEPLLQFGTLISVIGYITATQPRLGLLALAVVTPQAMIVLFTQAKINRRVARRVLILRRAINAVTEDVLRAAAEDVRADFDAIYETRRQIFVWKLSTKFVLSAINGVGTVGVLFLGGLLVIDGKSDVGTVAAATIGLARLQQPWRQLITFYRTLSAVQVKFELMREVLRDMSPDGAEIGDGVSR